MNVSSTPTQTRFGGFFVAGREYAKRQFWGGHPDTFRTFFAWASMSIGVFMALKPAAFANPGFTLMHLVAPVGVWSAMFMAHWALVSWCVHRQVHARVQICINFYGFVLWTSYVVLQDLSIGYFAINSSAERVMVLYSIWVMLRTGMGRYPGERA